VEPDREPGVAEDPGIDVRLAVEPIHLSAFVRKVDLAAGGQRRAEGGQDRRMEIDGSILPNGIPECERAPLKRAEDLLRLVRSFPGRRVHDCDMRSLRTPDHQRAAHSVSVCA